MPKMGWAHRLTPGIPVVMKHVQQSRAGFNAAWSGRLLTVRFNQSRRWIKPPFDVMPGKFFQNYSDSFICITRTHVFQHQVGIIWSNFLSLWEEGTVHDNQDRSLEVYFDDSHAELPADNH